MHVWRAEQAGRHSAGRVFPHPRALSAGGDGDGPIAWVEMRKAHKRPSEIGREDGRLPPPVIITERGLKLHLKHTSHFYGLVKGQTALCGCKIGRSIEQHSLPQKQTLSKSPNNLSTRFQI